MGSSPDWIKLKTIKLVCVACICVQVVRHVYPRTVVSVGNYYSKKSLNSNPSSNRTSSSFHWKSTCSRHDIPEKSALNNNHHWLYIQDTNKVWYSIFSRLPSHVLIICVSILIVLHYSDYWSRSPWNSR